MDADDHFILDASCSPDPTVPYTRPSQPIGTDRYHVQGNTIQPNPSPQEVHFLPSDEQYMHSMWSPSLLVHDINMYNVDEQEQIQFIQAMNTVQTQDSAAKNDAFNTWLMDL